jgi:uncharacterized protein
MRIELTARILKNKDQFRGHIVLLVLSFLLAVSIYTPAQESTPFSINNSPLPPPTGFVNDYAGVFDAATKNELETKLKTFGATTDPHVDLKVAVIRTTGGRDIADYALATYRGWKIGTAEGENPGALLLVAIDDRKYFTEVGRDLEDELPDGLVGSLQRQYLVPEFKKGNYAKGIADTMDSYIRAIQNKGNGNATPQPTSPGIGGSRSTGGGSGLFCCAVILLVIFLIIMNRSKGGRGGGGWGGGGGFGGALPWIIGGIINSAASSGRSSSDWGGSSGGWGGGSSDWGGGGGFGGFGGGGDAGGGGAGGSW